jgi:uncharacterized protein (TIGR00288 family)
MASTPGGEKRLALFIDFDNLALGMKNSPGKKFRIHLVLDRLLEKGKILVKKAYADWSTYRDYKAELHEAAIELIEVPRKRLGGKNSADIRMVVDALETAYGKEHLDTFALVTGDSDFSPLVSKLRENDREVIGIGIKAASSPLLIENCDEFIYYEDLIRSTPVATPPKELKNLGERKREAFALVLDALRALHRENREVVWASMVKQTIKRKRPVFDESYHEYGSFSELLMDMEGHGLIQLTKDQKSGSLIVTAATEDRVRTR